MRVPKESQEEILHRLNYVQGHINGIKKMVQNERQCVDVLTQISASYEGLRKVGQMVMRMYIENCVTQDLRSEDPDVVNRMYDEIMNVVYKYSK
jgi:DNA-binding FrmR family transcriptional regulator